MVKFFELVVICLTCHTVLGQDNALKQIFETYIFRFQSITSYFECKELSVFFNIAQKLGVPLPEIPSRPIAEKDVSFVFYSRQHVKPLVANTYDSSKSVRNLPINFKIPTVLFVVGLHRTYEEYVPTFKNALLPKENINLIFLNWDSYNDYSSTYSRNNTVPRLANILSKFLHQYIDAGANPEDIYLIGVSSGAQTIGIAGQQIYPKIGKILAVDPSGPCFNFAPDSLRVSPGDADFVQIVHCSIGKFGELSTYQGDVTFYMNGGEVQPQCVNKKSLNEVNKCSHNACAKYVLQTLHNFDKFVGVKCERCQKNWRRKYDCSDRAVMGYNASTEIRGMYYIDTESGSQSICKM